MNTESLFDLTGKVAVVTGGGDGIGKGCCKILASAGASVVVSDLTVEKAQATVDEIVEARGKAAATVCNVLNEDDLTALIEFAVKTYGHCQHPRQQCRTRRWWTRKSIQNRPRLC